MSCLPRLGLRESIPQDETAQMAYRCLLIDHDDTMLSTFDLRAKITAVAIAEVFGEEVDGAALLSSNNGIRLEEMAEQYTDDESVIETYVNTYRRLYYARNTDGIEVLPGVQEVIESLTDRGVPIAVVTNKWGQGARTELAAVGLSDRLPVVVGAEHVTHGKPHPEAIYRALELLNVSAEGALMVGDTSADIGAAKAAGVSSAAAFWGTQDAADLRKTCPDHYLEGAGEILPLFGFETIIR